MTNDVYAAVDTYLDDLFGSADAALAAALERSAAAGLPTIQVSPVLGRFLQVLALAAGARSILEIGTLGGYSTIWLGRAVPPDGRVVSLEVEPRYAAVARENIARAGLGDRVAVRVGRALDLLADLRADDARFDMVFIDADKPAYPDYLHAVLPLCRRGAVIVADNVVRAGKVAFDAAGDEAVDGAQRFNAALAADPRLASVVVQQVGVKGHDGMAIAVVRDAGPPGLGDA